MSTKPLNRYVAEFVGRNNLRDLDTVDQMASLIAGTDGKRLTFKALIAENGLSSGARG